MSILTAVAAPGLFNFDMEPPRAQLLMDQNVVFRQGLQNLVSGRGEVPRHMSFNGFITLPEVSNPFQKQNERNSHNTTCTS